MATMHVPLAAMEPASPFQALQTGVCSTSRVLDACRRCRDACRGLAQANGADRPSPELVRTLLATSRLAGVLAKYASDRDEAQRLGPIVLRACERTARACSRSGDDAQLRECADACAGCAEALRSFPRPGRRST